MTRRPVMIAVVSGLVCVICVAAYTHSIEQEVKNQNNAVIEMLGSEPCKVFVATDDVNVGEALNASNCTIIQYPRDLLPDEYVESMDSVEYKTIAVPLFKGQVVTNKHFENEPQKEIMVPAGLVAVSVPAKDVEAVGGLVKAGSHVDVYTTQAQGTDLLIEDVLVLDTSLTKDPQSSSHESLAWLTLAVEPTAVEELITASHKSELYFVTKSDVHKQNREKVH